MRKITVIVAAVAISGAGAGDEGVGDMSQRVERLSRPFGIGLWQIERCLLQEGRRGHLARSSALLEFDHQCPIEQK